MASDRWAWDSATKRFRDRDSGRFLSHARTRELRGEFLQARASVTRDLAERLATGLTVGEWEQGMRRAIKETHVTLAALGGGGRNVMTPADWGRVGRQLRDEYGYLRGFGEEIGRGELSEAQIAARSRLYLNAAVTQYERSLSSRWGVSLPVHPGEDSPCHGNCHCHWRIEEDAEEFRATWVLGASEDHCEVCVERASTWAPLVVPKDTAEERQLVSANGRHS